MTTDPNTPTAVADHPAIGLLHAELEGLRAKLAVVEKQRDEAQRKAESQEGMVAAYWRAEKVLDEALGTEEEDGAGEGLAADVWLLAQQRDEARGQRDALVAEVERIATKIYTPEFFSGYEVDSTLRHWRQGIAAELREAIAKTAPQPPTETRESTQDDETDRFIGLAVDAYEALRSGLWRRGYGWQDDIAPWLLDKVDEALKLLKARDEATATIAALKAANDEQDRHAVTLRKAMDRAEQMLGDALGYDTTGRYPGLPKLVEQAASEHRELAEARGETQRVRDVYRTHNQRLRDGVLETVKRLESAPGCPDDLLRDAIAHNARALRGLLDSPAE